jgi:hypothetical protein
MKFFLEVPGPRVHETDFSNWLAQRTFPEGQASSQNLPHELPNPPSEGLKAFLTPKRILAFGVKNSFQRLLEY